MLALDVVPLPVTDIDRRSRFTLSRPASSSTSTTGPTPAFELFGLTPPGSACSVQLVIADSLTGCTTCISSRPTSRTLGRN
jgi:hypothetical protein